MNTPEIAPVLSRAPVLSPAASSPTPVLSPTQVRCFMDCHARWWFKYNLKLPDPPKGNLALGRAVHWALTQNFTQKVETYEDLPLSGVLALFREAWALERDQAEFRDDEDPSQLAFAGEALVGKYLDEVAPRGRAGGGGVERRRGHRRGPGPGIHRCSGRRWPDYRYQDRQGESQRYRSHASVPGRDLPAVGARCLGEGPARNAGQNQNSEDRSSKLRRHPGALARATHTIYARASQAMRSKHYMPNRMSMFCSRRNCAHWRICEYEWGGEVPET